MADPFLGIMIFVTVILLVLLMLVSVTRGMAMRSCQKDVECPRVRTRATETSPPRLIRLVEPEPGSRWEMLSSPSPTSSDSPEQHNGVVAYMEELVPSPP